MRILEGQSGKLRTVAFSPGGSQLATAGDAGVTKLWHLSHRTDLATIRQPEGKMRIDQVLFSPDGTFLVTAGEQLRLWDLKTLAEIASPSGLGPGADDRRLTAFTPDGSQLIFMRFYQDERQGDLLVWEWRKRRWKAPFRILMHGYIDAFAVVPGSNLLAVAHSGYFGGRVRSVSLWDLNNKQVLGTLDHGRDCMHPLAKFQGVTFSSTGQTLVVAAGATPFVWDVPKHQLRGRLEGHARQVTAVACSPDGKLIATSSHDGTVRFWDQESLRERRAFDWQMGVVRDVAFSPDGMTAAAVGEKGKGKVVVWDVDL